MREKGHDLAGKTILVTRSAEQSAETGRSIAERGGTPLYLPCLQAEWLTENIRHSLPQLQRGPLSVLFTSCNGVHAVAETLGHAFAMLLKPHRIIAVGDKTGAVLRSLGVNIDAEPENASQEGLVALFKRSGTPEQILFYRAEEGNDTLADAVSTAGGKITTIHAYRMECPQSDASEIIAMMAGGKIDAVLLGSSKTTENYIRRIGNIETANIPVIAVISDQVATFAGNAGLKVQAVAKSASFDAMLDALNDYFKPQGA